MKRLNRLFYEIIIRKDLGLILDIISVFSLSRVIKGKDIMFRKEKTKRSKTIKQVRQSYVFDFTLNFNDSYLIIREKTTYFFTFIYDGKILYLYVKLPLML